MRTSIAYSLFSFLSFAAAYTAPVGPNPQGNPFSNPGLNEIVPKATPYKIKWNPTSPDNTVSLILLRGPSTNCVPLYPIVEKTKNSGEYEWTPKEDLEVDSSHYGIQLIDDNTGFYQYTTQFGIGNKTGDEQKKEEEKKKMQQNTTTIVTITTTVTPTSAPTSTETVAYLCELDADGQCTW
ncbi:Ser-Thr-rich glycosyl-phosphatidyl-inositol-anchored membrane family-domain-containing protein [Morchella snyderi]|nr:Ser-Thr-rich glycosyl-phosphatidyl-inositol-anchored membrane family-domain-containing protein [Morchella snyderi]